MNITFFGHFFKMADKVYVISRVTFDMFFGTSFQTPMHIFRMYVIFLRVKTFDFYYCSAMLICVYKPVSNFVRCQVTSKCKTEYAYFKKVYLVYLNQFISLKYLWWCKSYSVRKWLLYCILWDFCSLSSHHNFLEHILKCLTFFFTYCMFLLFKSI